MAAVSLVAATVIALCGSCAPQIRRQHAEYCAIMPDSGGLYVGNAVTQMGVRIGKITAITPDALSVRVNFTAGERPLPSDVKAVTRSPSILVDRSLELVGNYDSGPGCMPAGAFP
ncbi:mce related family protein [Mycobacterium xenopi 3993]|nr:mce related family protein [Mycobacterium xenopi 3993]